MTDPTRPTMAFGPDETEVVSGVPDRDVMIQRAPWPEYLIAVVDELRLYPNWHVSLIQGTFDGGATGGLRLRVFYRTVDSADPRNPRGQFADFPVPASSYNRRAWEQWVFDRLLDVHRHELGEFFRLERTASGCVTDGVFPADVTYWYRPFAPHHGPGRAFERTDRVDSHPVEQRIRQNDGIYAGWWICQEWLHDDAEHESCLNGGTEMKCLPVQRVPTDA